MIADSMNIHGSDYFIDRCGGSYHFSRSGMRQKCLHTLVLAGQTKQLFESSVILTVLERSDFFVDCIVLDLLKIKKNVFG